MKSHPRLDPLWALFGLLVRWCDDLLRRVSGALRR